MAKVSEKTSESEWKRMDIAEASGLMRELAKPVPVKVALYQAGEFLTSWTANRVRDVFHAEPRVSLSDREKQELRDAAAKRKREAERAETRDILDRLASLEARLASIDPEFHREQIEGIRASAHSPGPQED